MKHFKGCKKPEKEEHGVTVSCSTCGAFGLTKAFSARLLSNNKK
jgi:hypothetical protein